MNNFSEEKKQKQADEIIAEEKKLPVEGADIEFEESIDIDEIEKALMKQLESGDEEEEEEEKPSEEPLVFEEIVAQGESAPAQPIFSEVSPGSKKYVIYVNPENINFMENLSANERKEIVNKILREQDEVVAKLRAVERRKVYIRHLIVAVITFIIGFPLLFLIVNKSVEVTVSNYKQAQKNFINLYREKGKIQPTTKGH